MISEYLESEDLFNLRLSCRYLRECSFSRLIERYFHTRVHMLTLRSLETLLEISCHPVFGPSIRTLVIGERGDRPSVEELGFLQASGVITGYLTQILGNAVGCRTVAFDAMYPKPWGCAARVSEEHRPV